ncbi:unnamed protein product, partial [Phaeothamnion confervicola]
LAAAVASLARLKWSLSSGLHWNAKLVEAAVTTSARGIDVLDWGLKSGRLLPYRAQIGYNPEGKLYAWASASGLVATLVWARKKNFPWDYVTQGACLSVAARRGHLHVMQWVRENATEKASRKDCYRKVCEYAAAGGHLAVVRWARAQGYYWHNTAAAAARGNHLELLQWARANGCPWD